MTTTPRFLPMVLFLCALAPLPAQMNTQGWFHMPPTVPIPAPFGHPALGTPSKAWPFAEDVTGDGLKDLIFTGVPSGSPFQGDVVCIPGLAGGGFGVPIQNILPAAVAVRELTTDLNHDGNADLVGIGTGSTQGGAYGLIGDGAGGFTLSLPAFGISVWNDRWYDFGDLDNDGAVELVGPFGPQGANMPTGIWSWSGGGWVLTQTIPIVGQQTEVLIGDFNGDGWNDIFVDIYTGTAFPAVTQTWVYLNDTSGTGFVLTGPYLGGTNTFPIISDVDGDGCDDMVSPLAGSFPTAGLRVQRGDPQAVLLQPIELGTPAGLEIPGYDYPRMGDINGDGMLDWLWYHPSGFLPDLTHSQVMLGLGGGNFGPPYNEDMTPITRGGLSDVDGDGDADLIVLTTPSPPGWPSAEWGISYNEAHLAPGAPGGLGVPPLMSIGQPHPSNANFAVNLTQAWPHAQAILGVSWQPELSGVGPAGWWLDLNQLIFPVGLAGVMTTDATGSVSFAAPVPPASTPGLLGLTVYAQWAVADPGGQVSIGADNYTFSNAMKIIFW